MVECKFIFLWVFGFLSIICNGQRNRVTPNDFIDRLNVDNYSVIKTKYFGNAVDATNYLPRGYDKTARVDYTAIIQNAIDQNRSLLMPNFPILINANGLIIPTNSKILFQPNSSLILKGNSLKGYSVLSIENVRNVEIYFPRIVGDKYTHLNNLGEWGMGISIVGSYNISIHSAIISKCWGDGIYINRTKTNQVSNVVISKSFLNDNRRNGISIVSGKNIQIVNNIISNTYGANPQSGIDIEPNGPNDILAGIIIDQLITYNNYNNGVMIVLDNLVGGDPKTIAINIKNHQDVYSNNGFNLYIDRGYKKISNKNLNGDIYVDGVNYTNNKNSGIIFNKSKANLLHLHLSNININNRILRSNEYSNHTNDYLGQGKAFLLK